MLTCIAIDDEPLALRQLQSYIARTDFLQLEGAFASAIEAEHFLEKQRIQLIFVDINMPDRSGMDFVRQLSDRPMVIFTTAYAEHAVEGYRLDALDYLLKPFSFADFSRAVGKARSLQTLIEQSRIEPEVPDAARDFLPIRADHRTSLVRIADIVHVESVGEYIKLHLDGKPPLTTLLRLKNIEAALPAEQFMRVHRSYIINLQRIRSYAKGRVFLEDDGEGIPIGENYREAFAQYTKGRFEGL